MRMDIGSFASFLLGRPTLLALRSSLSVDSGISEKSMALSGICFSFLTARLPRADDANRLIN